MPRGNPKQPILIRLDPAVIAEVRGYTENLTGAVEEGLAWWLKRERRKADAEPLAKLLAPPAARERAVRRRA
jgi:hypothetical protein